MNEPGSNVDDAAAYGYGMIGDQSGGDTSSPTGSTGSAGNGFSDSLSALGGLSSVYNATQSQTPGSIIQGLQGAGTVINDISKLSGDGSVIPTSVGGALGAAGEGLGLFNALKDPSNPAADLAGALDAAKLYDTGSSLLSGSGAAAGSTIDSSLGAVGGLAGAGAIGGVLLNAGEIISQGEQRGPGIAFNNVNGVQVDPYGKLPSGNDIGVLGNVGYGAGNNEAQGSGQLYFVNPNGSTSDNTKYQWLGQQDTNAAIQDYEQYNASKLGIAEGRAANVLGDQVQQGAYDYLASMGVPQSVIATSKAETYQPPPQTPDTSGFASLYDSTGGQGKWGMDKATWINNIIGLMGASNQNTDSGVSWTIGQG